MGKQAVTSHCNSGKHEKNVLSIATSQNIKSLFQKPSSKDPVSHIAEDAGTSTPSDKVLDVTNTNVPTLAKPLLTSYLSKEDTMKAEIIWAMKLVTTHSSYNGFKDMSSIMKLMFHDSKIAQSVTMGSTKMAYIVTFGLAPYFMQCLRNEISGCNRFVICFEEALNHVSQKGQMDLVIRYWSTMSNKVCSRYLTSVFLGHSTAEDILKKFYEGLEDLSVSKLLQISMDGPNVNLKFLRLIMDELQEKDLHLLDLGSCGLHVVHGAFKTGHKRAGWNLNSVLKAMHRLFKDSPARRADFISITESKKFPLKFYPVRWVENVIVAERAIEVYSNVKLYLTKSVLPMTSTAEQVVAACNDKLMLAKIAFFSSIAAVLEPFLKSFQTDGVYIPYLYDAITDIVLQLMKRFIKRDIIEASKTPSKFLKIKCADTTNWVTLSDVDVGIATSRFLNISGATVTEKKNFRTDCRRFLIATVEKIIERSPLRFSIVRNIASLNPKMLLSNSVLCEKRFEKLLQEFHEKKHVSSIDADRAKSQFSTLCYNATSTLREEFSAFTREVGLDVFFASICDKPEYKELWEVIKLVLILSHGNASVESGFSINNDILVENLHDASLIALRTVYDAVKTAGGISSVAVSKEMLNHVKMSRQRGSGCSRHSWRTSWGCGDVTTLLEKVHH